MCRVRWYCLTGSIHVRCALELLKSRDESRPKHMRSATHAKHDGVGDRTTVVRCFASWRGWILARTDRGRNVRRIAPLADVDVASVGEVCESTVKRRSRLRTLWVRSSQLLAGHSGLIECFTMSPFGTASPKTHSRWNRDIASLRRRTGRRPPAKHRTSQLQGQPSSRRG